MKLLLGILAGLVVLVALGALLLLHFLRRLATSEATHDLVDSFDSGLAIPMRDGDTRRTPKEQER